MLDEICPVQFVEGLNEGAEPSDEETIMITYYAGAGIQYIPKVSYSLTGLEIMLVFGEIPEGTEIGVQVCSDYEDKPSDIILSSGSIVPKSVLSGWQEVILDPVSLIGNKNYWVIVNSNRYPMAFIKAEKGMGYAMCVRTDTRWKTPPENVKEGKVMLRFYGRILPISAS